MMFNVCKHMKRTSHWSCWSQSCSLRPGFYVVVRWSLGLDQGIPWPGGLSFLLGVPIQDGGHPGLESSHIKFQELLPVDFRLHPMVSSSVLDREEMLSGRNSQPSFLHILCSTAPCSQCYTGPYLSPSAIAKSLRTGTGLAC